MRLAVCTLSAVLLSGCSWLGSSSQNAYNLGHGTAGSAYGVGCATGVQGYSQQGFTQTGYAQQQVAYGGQSLAGNGCGPNGGYNVGGGNIGHGAYGGHDAASYGATSYAQAGYGQAGYGQGGFDGSALGGAQAIYGQNVGAQGYSAQGYSTQGFSGQSLYGQSGYGVGAVYGQNVVGSQLTNGQYVDSSYVQTVQGAPVYVAQPYPAYYGVPQMRGGFGGSAALPFGLEFGVGSTFDVGGDIYTEKPAGPAKNADGSPSTDRDISLQPAVSYSDAFERATSFDVATTYDLNKTTTLLGRVGYSKAEGKEFGLGEATENSVTSPITGHLSDLEQYTIEGGIRKYVGGFSNGYTGLRPYVGASAGMVHTNDVILSQTSAAFNGGTGGTETQQFIEAGWKPTAAGVIGAEYQVGARTAIGVETGVRWADGVNDGAESRWQVPVKLRGRVSF